MSEPRGCAAYWSEIADHVLERTKTASDAGAKMLGASGYPPLTEPITLADLKKMPPDQAKAILQDELARTTQRDPATGAVRFNKKTLDLATQYIAAQQLVPQKDMTRFLAKNAPGVPPLGGM